ncbi:MAG: hypothetical protein U0903_09745 [Planctomycetales bacterium]
MTVTVKWWSRKKNTEETKPAEQPQESVPADVRPSRLRRWLHPAPIVVSLVFVAVVVAVTTAPRWLPDLNRNPAYQVRAEQIRITPPPPWVPQDFVQRVLTDSKLPETLSLLDRDLVEEVANAFRRHPWVSKVEKVHKGYPGELSVEMRYRYPVAMVRVTNRLFPIDEQGVLLPEQDFTPEEAALYPQITKIASAPPLQAGQVWKDPLVKEGAQIATHLATNWKDFHLETIAAPSPEAGEEDKSFSLWTTGHTQILWGRQNENPSSVELTAKQKLGRLIEYSSRFQGFDGRGPYYIDIRELGGNIIAKPHPVWALRDDDGRRRQ